MHVLAILATAGGIVVPVYREMRQKEPEVDVESETAHRLLESQKRRQADHEKSEVSSQDDAST